MSSVHPLQTYSSSRTAAFADCLSRVCAALREVCRHGGLRSEIAWKQLGYGIESNSRCRERIRRLGKEESTLSTVVKDIAKKVVRQESHKACEEQQEVSEREEVIFGSHALFIRHYRL